MRGAGVGPPAPGRDPPLLLVPDREGRVSAGAGAPLGIPAGVHAWPDALGSWVLRRHGQTPPSSPRGAAVIQLLGRVGGGRPVPCLVPVPMGGADGVLVEPVSGAERLVVPRWSVTVRDAPRRKGADSGRPPRGRTVTFWLGVVDRDEGGVTRWGLWVPPDPGMPVPDAWWPQLAGASSSAPDPSQREGGGSPPAPGAVEVGPFPPGAGRRRTHSSGGARWPRAGELARGRGKGADDLAPGGGG